MSLAKKLEEQGLITKVDPKDYESLNLKENEFLLKISDFSLSFELMLFFISSIEIISFLEFKIAL